ncbi:hypothetical protein GCM10009624_19820 [Gordonia sinesedis]
MVPDRSMRRGRGRPPGPPVDVERRRELLLDAAERAVRRRGSDVGLAEVAAEAGLTRSAVYAAFRARDPLIDALAARHSRVIVERLSTVLAAVSDPREQTRAAIDILAAWFDDEPHLARLLMRRLNRAGADDSGGVVVTAVAAALRDGFVRRGRAPVAAQTWAHALVGAVSATVGWWATSRSVTRAELVDQLTDLVWSGFAGVDDADSGTAP